MEISQRARGRTRLCGALWIKLNSCVLRFESNSTLLLDELSRYFAPLLVKSEREHLRVTALQGEPIDLGIPFRDWLDESHQAAGKDSFCEVPGGRVCRKLRTGLQSLVGAKERLVFGDCLSNSNQVVNFIISQYLSYWIHRGFALCHAAGLSSSQGGLGLAGLPGRGKSTLSLALLSRGLLFNSNDRLLLRELGSERLMQGVPKMPRVNPGTLLNNPDLRELLPVKRRRELERLSPRALWEVEEKYDVMLGPVFGPQRIRYEAPLKLFAVLNWDRFSDEPVTLKRVDLRHRPDLLCAIKKSPGVFHTDAEGNPWLAEVKDQPYLDALKSTPVYEISGGVDFKVGAEALLKLLAENT